MRKRLLATAHLLTGKSLATFDFTAVPMVSKAQARSFDAVAVFFAAPWKAASAGWRWPCGLRCREPAVPACRAGELRRRRPGDPQRRRALNGKGPGAAVDLSAPIRSDAKSLRHSHTMSARASGVWAELRSGPAHERQHDDPPPVCLAAIRPDRKLFNVAAWLLFT